MWIDNQSARPVRYQKTARAGHTSRKSVASSTMIYSGLTIFLLVLIHLKQFKFGAMYEIGSPPVRDLYRTEVEVFSQPGWVVLYLVFVGLVALHLRHGIASAVQSLGRRSPDLHEADRARRDDPGDRHRRGLRNHSALGASHEIALMTLDSKAPAGPLADKWDRHRFESKLVNPANRRKFTIIIVGTGLAGASAASSLGELGYNVKSFCIHDSPRRAHSIAAQGGINAAKNYQNDGDSIQRLFYDTIKGGDYRSREANVFRLAQLSVNIIDQCVAQGVPFAREYGGLLDNRSFGGAQVSRTFYARGQTGQQLLLGAYQSMMRQVQKGTVEMLAQPRDARPGGRGRQGARHHLPEPGDRRDRAPRRRTPSCSARAATAPRTTCPRTR